MTLLAYRFALDPTPAQERALRSHCGAARFAFNWGLARVKAALDQRAAEQSYGVPDGQVTPVPWTLYALRREWNRAKGTAAPWWGQCSKEAFNTGLDALARALKNWAGSRKGTREGRRVGFPRFRPKHRARLSCRFTTGAVRCEPRHAVLPRLGRVKLHEDASGLTREVAAGAARVLSATVGFTRGRWFAAFTVEAETTRPAPRRPGAVVGVDLGIKTLAALSDGTEVANPRHLGAALRKVRRLSRAASRRRGPYDPATRRRRVPSRRWRRASAALARAHGRVADARRDGLQHPGHRSARPWDPAS